MSVAAAVAVLLCHYHHRDTTASAELTFQRTASPPADLSKEAVRARLSLVSACHPHARPTRSMLQQVWLYCRGLLDIDDPPRGSY
jgi:hypothetical protein